MEKKSKLGIIIAASMFASSCDLLALLEDNGDSIEFDFCAANPGRCRQFAGVPCNYGDGTFADDRDGINYRYVTICSQTWMAENLNYEVVIYEEEEEDNYEVAMKSCFDDPRCTLVYKGLYDWETAAQVCPDGWHLPTKSEWQTLLNYHPDGWETRFTKLKANFVDAGMVGRWWSNEVNSYHVVSFSNSSHLASGVSDPEDLLPIRCIKD